MSYFNPDQRDAMKETWIESSVRMCEERKAAEKAREALFDAKLREKFFKVRAFPGLSRWEVEGQFSVKIDPCGGWFIYPLRKDLQDCRIVAGIAQILEGMLYEKG